jgi:2-(1,2-epoxy-1,2-dihydrophenyl)acetyl-CoA isomerase
MTTTRPTTDSKPIALEIDDGLATVLLNAVEHRNAIGLSFALALESAAISCANDPTIRSVLLRADGPTFGVGGDLHEFTSFPPDARGEHVDRVVAALHSAVAAFRRVQVPIVAAAHGNVAGAAMSLLCVPDLVAAAADATFCLAYTRVGYTPDGGASWLLPRLVGERRALELLLLNRRLSADDALEWGLVNEVVPPGDLDDRSRALARALADGPTHALRGVKGLMRDGWARPLDESLQVEAESLARSVASREGVEGTAAYLEKRDPQFH